MGNSSLGATLLRVISEGTSAVTDWGSEAAASKRPAEAGSNIL